MTPISRPKAYHVRILGPKPDRPSLPMAVNVKVIAPARKQFVSLGEFQAIQHRPTHSLEEI